MDEYAVKKCYAEGDSCDTVWGIGKVQSFREADGLYTVLLDNWKLAQGQSPTLYLGADSLKKVVQLTECMQEYDDDDDDENMKSKGDIYIYIALVSSII